MKLIYLELALKCDSFDVAIGIKTPFFRDLITIEPGCSLLQFVTTNCLICLVSLFTGVCPKFLFLCLDSSSFMSQLFKSYESYDGTS